MLRSLIFGAAAAALCASAVSAHVTLERQETSVGGSYKGVLRVPHGCKGSPTTAIRVRIPDGIIGVKPMPKPGWTLNTVTGKYPKTYTLRGAKVSEGVTEIAWAGGKLADAHYDEFVFTSVIAEELQAGTIYFPVVQECEQGVHRWIDIPKKGHDSDGHGEGAPEPAPGLRLLPKSKR